MGIFNCSAKKENMDRFRKKEKEKLDLLRKLTEEQERQQLDAIQEIFECSPRKAKAILFMWRQTIDYLKNDHPKILWTEAELNECGLTKHTGGY